MEKKSGLMNVLKKLSEKRLLTSEVEALFDPYKDTIFPLSLNFVSAAKSFGSQKVDVYNDGYSVICNAENWEVEVSLLFAPKDNDLVESFEHGKDFEVNVWFIDYDALYQRAFFGKSDSETGSLEEEMSISSSEINDTSSVDNNITEDFKDSLSQPEFEVIEPMGETTEPNSDARLDLLQLRNSRKKSIGPSAEEIKEVSKEEIRAGQSYSSALPQPSQLEKSGCWCLLLGGLVLMGSIIALGDGMDSFGFIIIGLLLCFVGGLSLLISKVTKKMTVKVSIQDE